MTEIRTKDFPGNSELKDVNELTQHVSWGPTKYRTVRTGHKSKPLP